jgi:actin-related protein 6
MRGYVKEDDAEVEAGEQILGLDTERFSVPEVLFHPSDVGMAQAGIAEATWQSLQEMNQVEMGLASSNLVLTGGNMSLPQIQARYNQEVRRHIPDIFEADTYCPENPIDYAWKGAARFVNDQTARGTLNEHMISRADYLERGHDYVNEKFFRGW